MIFIDSHVDSYSMRKSSKLDIYFYVYNFRFPFPRFGRCILPLSLPSMSVAGESRNVKGKYRCQAYNVCLLIYWNVYNYLLCSNNLHPIWSDTSSISFPFFQLLLIKNHSHEIPIKRLVSIWYSQLYCYYL